MNYLWEIALKGREQNRPLTSITFKQSATPSPYMEAAFADINWQELSDEPVEVNVLYRFSQIFAGILDDSLAENPDLRDALIDLLLHYLTLLDLRAGLCRQEYYVRFLREDIESGRYGLDRDILTSFAGEQIRYVFVNVKHFFLWYGKQFFPSTVSSFFCDTVSSFFRRLNQHRLEGGGFGGRLEAAYKSDMLKFMFSARCALIYD